MEFLSELIFSLVLDVGIEGAKDNKLPKWVRVIFMSVITIIYLLFIAFFIYAFISNDNIVVKVLSVIIVALCGGFLLYFWRKIILHKKDVK